MKSQVSILKCVGYEPAIVQERVREAIDLIGGISAFIKPGSKVLVKPNLLMAKEPECGITTHPEVVRAVIKTLKEINCSIFVGDGPCLWKNQIKNVDEVYERTGISKVCREERAELVRFDKRRWRGNFPLSVWLDHCDHLISIPKFKTHEFMLITGAIKNNFGLVSGTYKTELHKKYFDREDFSKAVVDVYQEAKPSLTIIDGILAMEGDGPASGGKLRNLNLLLAGSDCVSLDSLMALIMGIEPLEVMTTKEAAERGLGKADIDSITVLGENLEGIIGQQFLLPITSMGSRLPAPVKKLAKKLIKYLPCVERDNCVKCAACIEACPQRSITMGKDVIIFDYSKCISCFCCQEACPSCAIKVKKSLLAKILGL
ncbi:MAG: DUF362 domain-containing protein [Candidatus Omnitrophota bacterium]